MSQNTDARMQGSTRVKIGILVYLHFKNNGVTSGDFRKAYPIVLAGWQQP